MFKAYPTAAAASSKLFQALSRSGDVKTTLLKHLQKDFKEIGGKILRQANAFDYEERHNECCAFVEKNYRAQAGWDEAILYTVGFRYFSAKVQHYNIEHSSKRKIGRDPSLTPGQMLHLIHPDYNQIESYGLTFKDIVLHLYFGLDALTYQKLANSLTSQYVFKAILFNDPVACVHWLRLLALLQIIAELKEFTRLTVYDRWAELSDLSLVGIQDPLQRPITPESRAYQQDFFYSETAYITGKVKDNLVGLAFVSNFLIENNVAINAGTEFAEYFTEFCCAYLRAIIAESLKDTTATDNDYVDEVQHSIEALKKLSHDKLIKFQIFIHLLAGNVQEKCNNLRIRGQQTFHNSLAILIEVHKHLKAAASDEQLQVAHTINYSLWQVAVLLAADDTKCLSMFYAEIGKLYANEFALLNLYLIHICRALNKPQFSIQNLLSGQISLPPVYARVLSGSPEQDIYADSDKNPVPENLLPRVFDPYSSSDEEEGGPASKLQSPSSARPRLPSLDFYSDSESSLQGSPTRPMPGSPVKPIPVDLLPSRKNRPAVPLKPARLLSRRQERPPVPPKPDFLKK